ncbi:sirohydrochlorin chelatase [Calothrix rhizosoleniae]|uniref:sirohydrochlorin chelatase n=1 Tax=Calothrix rhizosoleniae TaxID=888997 RepID=UPI000B49E053|nr:sirohydrochlorin chelatase [Calothrix rhizosoleniae]
MSTAYLLVSHGSRDPRPEIAMQTLVGLVKKRVQSKLLDKSLQLVVAGVTPATISYDVCIGTACLEFSSQPLNEQIRIFAKQAILQGCNHLTILPLFLLPGIHVMEDIPTEVSQAQQALGGEIKLDLQPYLGSEPAMKWLVAKQMVINKVDVWVLLSHGSRRPGSLQQIEAIANDLGAVSAYWAVAPSLGERIPELVSRGYKKIGILPYFFFPGGITDAIAQSIEGLKLQFPEVNLQLAQPLAATTDLADLIGDVIVNETHTTKEGQVFG